MKLFKEIKRRVRNVARAAAGKDIFPPMVEMPITREQVKVETFAAEQYIGPIVEAWTKNPEEVVEFYRRQLAVEIGRKLLEEGVLMEELSQRPHEPGLRGYTLRLSARVVIPEERRVSDET